MKKKSTIFFVMLFAVTLMFSFGLATTAQADDPCCDLLGCPGSQGHYVGSHCVRDWSHWCDLLGFCQ